MIYSFYCTPWYFYLAPPDLFLIPSTPLFSNLVLYDLFLPSTCWPITYPSYSLTFLRRKSWHFPSYLLRFDLYFQASTLWPILTFCLLTYFPYFLLIDLSISHLLTFFLYILRLDLFPTFYWMTSSKLLTDLFPYFLLVDLPTLHLLTSFFFPCILQPDRISSPRRPNVHIN